MSKVPDGSGRGEVSRLRRVEVAETREMELVDSIPTDEITTSKKTQQLLDVTPSSGDNIRRRSTSEFTKYRAGRNP